MELGVGVGVGIGIGGEESMELKVKDGVGVGIGIGIGIGIGVGCERMAQWSEKETKDFISIRAQLDQNFVHTKRNKSLWELIASKMREMRYRRTADQCKCKWKNLVARYKETSPDTENGARQCPFFDQLRALFTEKARKRMGGKRKLLKFSDECSDEGEEEEEEEEQEQEQEHDGSEEVIGIGKKKKSDKDRLRVTAERSRANSMQEILEDFFKQQQHIEMQWRESVEAREAERRAREIEWQQTMGRLEEERMMMERAWREREDQRRARQDARADNRDALLTALLTKLIHPDL